MPFTHDAVEVGTFFEIFDGVNFLSELEHILMKANPTYHADRINRLRKAMLWRNNAAQPDRVGDDLNEPPCVPMASAK